MIYKYPYKYVVFKHLFGKEWQYILLVYHNKSKIIVQQETPFKVICPQCRHEHDSRYLNNNIHSVMEQLLKAGWIEDERGEVK